MSDNIYHAGDLAYIDTLRSGLVPCKVVSVSYERHFGNDWQVITVKVTGKRPGYKRGDVTTGTRSTIIPRDHIFTRAGQYRILAGYIWE